MKRLAVFIAVLLTLTLLPSAHAAFRMQSVSSGLFSLDGPTKIGYSDSAFRGSYYHDADTRFISARSTRGGPGVSIAMQRPSYTEYHTFEQPKYNYRTREYGDWQLTNAQARWPDKNTNIGISKRYDQYGVRGNINGYTGGSTALYASTRRSNAFAYANNARSFGYPYTYSNYGYASTPSAYTSSGSGYY